MFIGINVPDIGVDKFEVIEIMVKVGDEVDIEQSLITVEGDKASMEIPSPQVGIVKEIKVSVGDKVTTGNLIMVFDTIKTITKSSIKKFLDSNIDKIDHKDDNLSRFELKKVVLPDISNNEIEVTDIMVDLGNQIYVDQSLITVKSEKGLIEVPAPFSGEVKEIKVIKGDKVKTGSLIMIFSVYSNEVFPNTGSEITISKIPKKLSNPYFEKPKTSFIKKKSSILNIKNKFIEKKKYVYATPLIRRLASEFDINLSKINGTGRKGRIIREDFQNYIKEAIDHFETKVSTTESFLSMKAWPKIDFSKFGEVEEVELNRTQKIFSANLSRNWTIIPHVTLMEDADITEVESFRNQQNKEMERLRIGIKITPLVFIMKAVARALEEMLRFNSSISEDTKTLTLKKYVHIGIAIDTENGLVVPVIRDVNKKGIIDLSKRLMEVSKKARSGKLTVSDMQGGSFTISSLGGIGTTNFTPIINAPEVAIIGLSRSSIKPVWNGTEFISRIILPMSLSFDHRVINGADGARFLTRIAQLMSDIRHLVM
ncbi:MAG: 2-oxo acid dehydrogenase subunit E2 [Arsenophonus sp.]